MRPANSSVVDIAMDTPDTTEERSRPEAPSGGDLLFVAAAARRERDVALAAALRALARALGWPIRAALIEPFRAWRRRERIRTELTGMPDGMLHDIGITRDRLPYLVANEQDRDAA